MKNALDLDRLINRARAGLLDDHEQWEVAEVMEGYRRLTADLQKMLENMMKTAGV